VRSATSKLAAIKAPPLGAKAAGTTAGSKVRARGQAAQKRLRARQKAAEKSADRTSQKRPGAAAGASNPSTQQRAKMVKSLDDRIRKLEAAFMKAETGVGQQRVLKDLAAARRSRQTVIDSSAGRSKKSRRTTA
jgi:hypothetical protein